MIAHAVELRKIYPRVIRRQAALRHQVHQQRVAVLVVRARTEVNAVQVVHAVGEGRVEVLIRIRLGGLDGVRVALLLRAVALFLHVGPAHQLHTQVVALLAGRFQVAL